MDDEIKTDDLAIGSFVIASRNPGAQFKPAIFIGRKNELGVVQPRTIVKYLKELPWCVDYNEAAAAGKAYAQALSENEMLLLQGTI